MQSLVLYRGLWFESFVIRNLHLQSVWIHTAQEFAQRAPVMLISMYLLWMFWIQTEPLMNNLMFRKNSYRDSLMNSPGIQYVVILNSYWIHCWSHNGGYSRSLWEIFISSNWSFALAGNDSIFTETAEETQIVQSVFHFVIIR